MLNIDSFIPILPVAAPAAEVPCTVSRPQRLALELRVNAESCLSCGGCVSVCPRMDIPVSSFNSIAEGVLCRGCGLCVRLCPVSALSQEPVPTPPARQAATRQRDRIIPAYTTADRS